MVQLAWDDIKLAGSVYHLIWVDVAIKPGIAVGIRETRTSHRAWDGVGLEHDTVEVVVALFHVGKKNLHVVEAVVQDLVLQFHVFQLTRLTFFFRRLEEGEQQHGKQECDTQQGQQNQEKTQYFPRFWGLKHLKILGQLVEYVTRLFCHLSIWLSHK